jgi:FkbM family methyltransferase
LNWYGRFDAKELSVNARLRRVALLLLPPLVVDAIRSIRRPTYRAEPPGSAVVATPASVAGPASCSERKYWGLHDLDHQIEKYLEFDSGYYVELGANDGRLSSNTLYYERFRNWRGVLIEPAPNLYLECRKNRSSQNKIVCAACVSFDYKDEFVKVIYSDSMSVTLNVETDIADGMAHAELGRQFLKPWETVFTFGAVARTLSSILLEAKAPRVIDFLSLDVEGAEIEVLKGVDHKAFKFRYMLVECRDIERLRSYLEPLDYRLLEQFNEHDYMFEHAGGLS